MHDTVEDTDTTIEEIQIEFGADIAGIRPHKNTEKVMRLAPLSSEDILFVSYLVFQVKNWERLGHAAFSRKALSMFL